MRVMVVDDSTPIRQRLVAEFRKAPGVEAVSEAPSGKAALASVDDFRPDWVILDLMLPDMSGIEVLEALKQRHPSVRVAVFTNYPYPEFRRRCLELGATHFLGKTTEVERILELVLADRSLQAGTESEGGGVE
ncbi:MAG: response regulator transcription factor [Longimicrobiales bacterium]|nr:response regulator transcription factor [Longimicrobiales bacterium]